MSNRARRYKVGDPVIWTSYADGSKHPCEILSYIEDPEYDPDLNGNGPLYVVRLNPDRPWETQVVEKDLSPRQADDDGELPGDPFGPGEAEPEHQGEDIISPLERLRRQHRADDEARRAEWLADHAGDPDDPFTQAEIEAIFEADDQDDED